MCNIWRIPRDEFLCAEDYRNLPASLKNVNITGGEALLRPDAIEIIQTIYESTGRPRMIVATNGFRPEKTIEQMLTIRAFAHDVGVAVSLDGIESRHDYIRGVPHAYSRVLQTIKSLVAEGITDIRIGYTATAENIDQLPLVYHLADELGVELSATVAQNSETYYAIANLEKIDPDLVERYFGMLIDCHLKSFVMKDWFRAYFAHGVIHFVKHGRRMTACSAATDFFYLSPQGDVYPCLTLPDKIGNLRDAPFDTLWFSERAMAVAKQAQRCQACWMVCTARVELKKAPIKAVAWVLREKLARHLVHTVDTGRDPQT